MVEFDKKVTIVEGTSPQRSNSNPKKSATSFARRRAKGPDKLSMVTRARDPNRGNSQQRRGSLVSRAARYVTSSGVQPRTTMGSQLIAHRIRQTHRLTLRERAFLILEEPTSSLVARLVSLVVTLATLVATTAATLETCRDGELGEVWKQGGDDLFAHYSAIGMEGYKTLKAGQLVSFDTIEGPKGLHAANIHAVEGAEVANDEQHPVSDAAAEDSGEVATEEAQP